MATLDQINAAVLEFAKSTSITMTPATITDPIVPTFASMTSAVFSQFYFDLLSALTEGQIAANVPMEGLKNATVWFHVSTLIFHFQSPQS